MLRISETGREYVDEGEDSLLERLLGTLNEIPAEFEYCPTGEGGGIDPTCSPGHKSGVEESQFKNKQVLADIETWPKGLAKMLARDAADIGGSPNPGERLLVYRGAGGAVQGVMLYGQLSKGKLGTEAHIHYLASNERGAGTNLMRHAFERAVSENRDLSLQSTGGALGFYRKMGMHEDEGTGIFTISAKEMKERLAA